MTRIPDSELKLRTAYRKEHGSEEGFVPPPRKRRRNEESVMQRNLIRWWAQNCRLFGVPEILLFSIPNGFNGDARRGSVMKLEGQRKGAPDLVVCVPRRHGVWPVLDHGGSVHSYIDPVDYHGLFLELKRPTGTVSPEQEVFHQRLTEHGYAVKVCRSLAECIDTITTYLTK